MKIVLVTANLPPETNYNRRDIKIRISYENELTIVGMEYFAFYMYPADCYIFETDEKLSPWFLQLGRYLPGQHDWTTTSEILERTGTNPQSGLAAVQQLIIDGKVVPFEPFKVTYLFLRRHYSVLFSEENCKLVGCDKRLRGVILGIFYREIEKGWEHRHYSVEDFLERYSPSYWEKYAFGVGPKLTKVICEILKRHGFTPREQ